MRVLDNAYALIIGVDNKQQTDIFIKDAQSMYNVLSDEKLCGYKKENITLLTDQNATTANILKALNDYTEKMDEESSFLMFYSGHGGYDAEQSKSCLMPIDVRSDNLIYGKDLRERLSQMKSKRMFILFDCCHSASFFDKNKDEIISNAVTQNVQNSTLNRVSTLEGMAQEIDNEQGMVIMASSQAEEHSWAGGGNYCSIFTESIMEALRAENLKHKHFLVDKFVRTVETANYVFERTPEKFRELKKLDDERVNKGKERAIKDKNQMPYANLQMSSDFAICYIPEELEPKISTKKYKRQEIVIPKGDSKPSWEREEGNNLLLFLHGFSGESKDTFGDIPSMLQSDSNFDGWAMKPLGYSPIAQPKLGKDIWGAILDVDKIAGFLKTSIQNKFRNYDRIAIVAHSLGGLVAQKSVLLLDEDNRNRISHLIMFGTPSNGIAPEILEKQWNKKYSELSSDGNYIKSLRKEWENTFKDTYPFKLKVVASTDDEYVTLASCHKPFSEEHREYIEGKHLYMVKPKSNNDPAYALIIDTLTGSKFFKDYNNSEEVNLVLGKYDSVVKKLLPNKDDLDKVGLTQLIFALEGLERKEEVYDILNNHPLAKRNTDLMGIIGGRHKRDYLKTSSFKSSELSREYYNKALEISVENGVHSQIYYHAINLAFLSIVTDPETGKSEMKRYANQALEATTHCDDNLWKFATVAEANMYLGNLEVAKEFYIKASEDIPVREKVSMYTNAYAGYVALTSKENDEFTEFLKAQLMN